MHATQALALLAKKSQDRQRTRLVSAAASSCGAGEGGPGDGGLGPDQTSAGLARKADPSADALKAFLQVLLLGFRSWRGLMTVKRLMKKGKA